MSEPVGSLSNLVFFPKQRETPPKPRKPKPSKKKPEPKSTTLDWIRNGYTFPGKP